MNEDKGEVYKVRGHLCEGLKEHLEAAHYGCIPRLIADGTILACDADNPVPIAFCPFCGVSLRVREREKNA